MQKQTFQQCQITIRTFPLRTCYIWIAIRCILPASLTVTSRWILIAYRQWACRFWRHIRARRFVGGLFRGMWFAISHKSTRLTQCISIGTWARENWATRYGLCWTKPIASTLHPPNWWQICAIKPTMWHTIAVYNFTWPTDSSWSKFIQS